MKDKYGIQLKESDRVIYKKDLWQIELVTESGVSDYCLVNGEKKVRLFGLDSNEIVACR